MALPVKPADVPEDLENPVRGEPRGTFAAKANEFLRRLVEDYTPALNEMADWINNTAIEIESIASDVESDASSASASASSASDSKIYIDQVIGTLQQDIVINDTTPSYTEVFSSQTTLDNIEAPIDDTSSVTDTTLSSSEIDDRIETASSAAGTALEATAKGSLVNGDLVSLLPDGRVEVTRSNTAIIGSSNQYDSGSVSYTGAVKISENLIVIVFEDNSNSNSGTAVAGTVSGETITFGSQVVFESSLTGNKSLAIDRVSDTSFIVSYKSSSGNLKCISGSISGNSVSFPSAAITVKSSTTYGSDIVAISENQAIIFYSDINFLGKYYFIDISSNTLSLNAAGEQSFGAASAGIVYLSCAFNGTEVAVSYDDGNTSAGIRVSASTIGSGVLNFGPDYFLIAGVGAVESQLIYVSDDSLIAVYTDGSSSVLCRPILAEGSTLTLGAEQTLVASTIIQNSTNMLSKITDNYAVFAYSGTYAIKIEAIGTSLSIGPTVQIVSESSNYVVVSSLNDDEVVVVVPDSLSKAYVYSPPYDNTSGWIGFSKSDYVDGESSQSHVMGGIANNQSGLGINSRYYLDVATASLTTTDTGVEVGRAVAADKILITGSGV